MSEVKEQKELVFFDSNWEFVLCFTNILDHWIDFKVVEVIAEALVINNEKIEERFLSYRNKDDYSDFNCKDINQTEVICTGHIKWDGCMELHDLNYHFCGYSDTIQRLVKMIYLEAKNNIISFDEDLANIK